MPRPPNAYRPLAEDLLALPGAQLRRMFGAEAIYVDGVMLLVLADGDPPWNGLLFPAERDRHAAIREEFPFLVPHEVLPKWLLLTAEDDRFEFRAQALLACLLARDERFGVIPKPKKKKGTSRSAKESAKPTGAEPDGRPPHLR